MVYDAQDSAVHAKSTAPNRKGEITVTLTHLKTSVSVSGTDKKENRVKLEEKLNKKLSKEVKKALKALEKAPKGSRTFAPE